MAGPVIGVVAASIPAVPGERPASWGVGRRYLEVLRRVGGVPWLIPPLGGELAVVDSIAPKLDGVLLAGGVDLDPARYGEARHPLGQVPDPDRDVAEVRLLELAVAAGRPVLAICRGLQLLNVSRGGTLYQDIASQVPAALKHDLKPIASNPARDVLAHEVTAAAGSRLADFLGESVVAVNSAHHQAVKDLGAGLRPTAFAPDGVIEGLEDTDPGRWVVAVQWHPEELADGHPGMRRLFAALVAAAGG